MNTIEQVYKDYSIQVYRYAYSLCHEHLLAEEITQETFFRAIKNINSYNGNCKFYVWLCQIAKHVFYQEVNRQTKYRKFYEHSGLDSLCDSTMANASSVASLEELTIQKETHMDFIHQLDGLPENMKEVVGLRVLGEYSFREIREIMNKNETWARVTFYRAKQIIMKGMDHL